jgi:hypothetical protein
LLSAPWLEVLSLADRLDTSEGWEVVDSLLDDLEFDEAESAGTVADILLRLEGYLDALDLVALDGVQPRAEQETQRSRADAGAAPRGSLESSKLQQLKAGMDCVMRLAPALVPSMRSPEPVTVPRPTEPTATTFSVDPPIVKSGPAASSPLEPRRRRMRQSVEHGVQQTGSEVPAEIGANPSEGAES